MTRAVLLSYLGVALLGGLIGGLTMRLTTTSPKPPRAVASAEPESSGDSSSSETRIAELEKAVAALQRERKMTRLAAAYGSALGAAEDAGAPPGSVVDDPVFQAAVRDVMDQVATEKRDERKSDRDERRKKATERWTSQLGQTLGLSDAQKQKVAAAVQGYFEDLRALRDADERPTDWRQKMEELRKKREGELSQALTPEQKQKYDALEDDEKLGAGFGGRRRGGRGGGGDAE